MEAATGARAAECTVGPGEPRPGCTAVEDWRSPKAQRYNNPVCWDRCEVRRVENIQRRPGSAKNVPHAHSFGTEAGSGLQEKG